MHEPGQRSSYGELKNAWRNFQDFRLDGHFCDVTLKTDTENGRLFRAHRAVLCAGKVISELQEGTCTKAHVLNSVPRSFLRPLG